MLDKATTRTEDIITIMDEVGRNARYAAKALAIASSKAKNDALNAMADSVLASKDVILAANSEDLRSVKDKGLQTSFIDRLTLTEKSIVEIAQALREIAALKDPVGDIIAAWDRPNGLNIERVRTPLGVIGVIYESRPNVTADAGALCLKAGNAVILRGGSDSLNSSRAIHQCLVQGLRVSGLPQHAIQIVPTTDRAAVGAMLGGLNGNIDVIVPRGGKSLVARVQSEARVPVFAHLEGLCHIYVDTSANLEMAKNIVVNAKMRRTGICGAAETLLIDSAAVSTHLVPIIEALLHAGCEIRASAAIIESIPGLKPATEQDWRSEYLEAILSVAIVDGISGAISHINTYSSNHTEAVIAEDHSVVERFFNEIDSAILLHNASTQFADGGEFGMGGEIGIATGKMHARGPVGVEQLTSFKYRVHGTGQVRP